MILPLGSYPVLYVDRAELNDGYYMPILLSTAELGVYFEDFELVPGVIVFFLLITYVAWR
jgi:hypothetical protein